MAAFAVDNRLYQERREGETREEASPIAQTGNDGCDQEAAGVRRGSWALDVP